MRHCIIDSKAKYQCMVQYWIFLNDSRVTWQKYVRNSLHLNRFKGPGGVPLYLSSLFYRLLSPLFITPLPSLPLSLWNTITEMRGEVDCQQEGWKMTAGCDLVRLGEVSHQQVWMMTAGWRGVTLTASRGWRMSAGQRGWVWPLAGVDNDCLVERGEFDRQQGWNCWAGRGEFEAVWRIRNVLIRIRIRNNNFRSGSGSGKMIRILRNRIRIRIRIRHTGKKLYRDGPAY